MKEVLCKLNKETRCYIMSAIMVFEGYNQLDDMTGVVVEMKSDVLGLTKEDIAKFPMPTYPQIVSCLKPILDSEVRHWIIMNTYHPVLKCRRADALRAFRAFCSDLGWDDIKDSVNLAEELFDLKPIDNDAKSTYTKSPSHIDTTGPGCLSGIVLIIVSTLLFMLL